MKFLISIFMMTFSLTALAGQFSEQLTLEDLNEFASTNVKARGVCKKVNLTKQQRELIKEKVTEAKKARNISKAEMKNLLLDHMKVLFSKNSTLADAERTRDLIQEKKALNSKSFSDNRLDILFNVLEPKQRPAAIRCFKKIVRKKATRK